MKRYIAFLALALTVKAQQPANPVLVENLPTLVNRYLLSQSTTKLTVQAPANIGVTIVLESAEVTCDADSTVTESWKGTAATTTVTTPGFGFYVSQAARAIGYTDSNVGSGITGKTFSVSAGITKPLTLTNMQFSATGPIQNYTLTTTNTCTIQLMWREQ